MNTVLAICKICIFQNVNFSDIVDKLLNVNQYGSLNVVFLLIQDYYFFVLVICMDIYQTRNIMIYISFLF